MGFRLVLWAILIATTATAQWKRYVDEELLDSPPAHKLAYFLVDPCLRSDANDRRVYQCDLKLSAVELERPSKTRTSLRVVGKIGQLIVYDLEYFFSDQEFGPNMKSVLVQTAANEVREIDVRSAGPRETLLPTQILRGEHGQPPVIKVNFDDAGIYHFVHEEYFVILNGVALLVDFTPVFDAALKIIPNGMTTYQPTSRFDFKSHVFHIQTEKLDANIGPKVACCEGRVEVPFRIEQGRVIASNPKYFPE